MGAYEKALEWYEKARVIVEQALGNEHPSTANTYNNIAGVYYAMGAYEAALILYRKAYKVILYRLGQNHPNTQICYDNMSKTYNKTSRDKTEFEIWLSASDDPN